MEFRNELSISPPTTVPTVGDIKKINPRLASLWGEQQSLYGESWKWISGEALRAVEGNDPKTAIKKYPLEVNPVQWIAQKHSEILWGEVPDEANSPVTFEYRADNKTRPASLEDQTDILNRVWYDSYPKDMLSRAGYLGQFLAGSVLKIARSEQARYGIRIESVLPDFFLPIFDSGNPWDLLESFTCYYISPEEAQSNYGISVASNLDRVVYTEHWTRYKYEILVDGKTPTRMFGVEDYESAGENQIGSVPFVYIPHYIRTGSNYGYSHVPTLAPLIYEYNSRLADAGDYVRENSYGDYVLKNTVTAPKAITLPNGKQGIDIGKAQMGSTHDPELGKLQTSNVQGNIHLELPRQLMEAIQRDGAVPNIAWGQDEGSQRSAITLAFKMWPLTSHIRRERAMWTEGFKQVNSLVLKTLIDLGNTKLTEDALNDLCFTKWEPMTPRDRLDLVNEIATLLPVKGISRKRAVQLLNRGEDITEEINEIKSDMEKENELGHKAQQNLANSAANNISQQANQ